jgi:hypothetical protein
MPDETPPIKMGPVIGGMGDVNVTHVVSTEKDADCTKCGKHCTKGHFFTCPSCSKAFCDLHFNRDLGLCASCESGKEKSSEAEFLSFLKKTVSDDNKITGPELIKLKKEGIRLGLEAADINQIIKDFQNKGLKGTTQDLIESATKLYSSEKIREASERLAKFSEEQILEHPQLLDLYLKIQAILDPSKLLRFLEDWPVETEERFVAEFCVREDRVEARSILYALKDRKQDDLFAAERIQICWHLSEFEENLQLADREKLHQISKTIKEKAVSALPSYQSIFHDLCDILDLSRDFAEQPPSIADRIDKFSDSIAQRAARICRQAWERFSRSVKTPSSSVFKKPEVSVLESAPDQDRPEPDSKLLWDELARVKTIPLPEIAIKTKACLFHPLGVSREISSTTSLGRDFFKSWGDDFGRFMDSNQFTLIKVHGLNAELWGIRSSSWSGWVLAPNLNVKNSSNLNGKVLTTPHLLIEPTVLSIGKTGKCKVHIECRPAN